MKTLTNSRNLTLVRKQVDQPVDFLALWEQSPHYQKSYWAIPDEGLEFIALGSALNFGTQKRRNRFDSVREGIRNLQFDLVGEPGPDLSAQPRLPARSRQRLRPNPHGNQGSLPGST